MSDAKIVNTGENTPEEVAYKLLSDVMSAEGKSLFKSENKERVDRKYILDTYAECLKAGRAPQNRNAG